MSQKSKSLTLRETKAKHSREVSIPLSELMPVESHYNIHSNISTHVMSTLVLITSVFVLFVFALKGSTFGLVGLLGFIAISILRKSRSQRAIQKNQIAVNLLNDTKYDEAAVIFEELVNSQQNTPAHPVYVFNRGVSFLLSGSHRKAFALFNSVARSKMFSFAEPYKPILYADMATCLILDNQLEAAGSFLQKAKNTKKDEELGFVILAEVIYLARLGHDQQAFQHIIENWELAERTLRLPSRRALSLVFAFVASRSGHADYVLSALEQLGPFDKTEFYWIYRSWREIFEFLENLN